MVTKQVYGQFGNSEQTCAIGAAQVAFGDRPGFEGLAFILEQPADMGPCPVNGCAARAHSPGAYIVHLNDYHKMPRQQIADYVSQFGL